MFYWQDSKFSDRLRYFMSKSSINSKQLAKALGISESAISLWLSDKREPRDEHISALCNFFEVDYIHFMHTEEEISAARLDFFFKKLDLDIDDYEKLNLLEDELTFSFRELIKNYKKKDRE